MEGDEFLQRVLVEHLTRLAGVRRDVVKRQLGEVGTDRRRRRLQAAVRRGVLCVIGDRRAAWVTFAAATPRSPVMTGTAVGDVDVAPPIAAGTVFSPVGAAGISAPSPRPKPLRRSLTECPPPCSGRSERRCAHAVRHN